MRAANLKFLLTFLSLVLPALCYADTSIITHTRTVFVVPVVDTNIYAAGDNVGGKLTFADMVRGQVYSGEVCSVIVTD